MNTPAQARKITMNHKKIKKVTLGFLASILRKTVSSNIFIQYKTQRSRLSIHADTLTFQTPDRPVFEIYYTHTATKDGQENVDLVIHLSGSDYTQHDITIPLSYTKLFTTNTFLGIKHLQINRDYLERKLLVHEIALALWAEGCVKDLEQSVLEPELTK